MNGIQIVLLAGIALNCLVFVRKTRSKGFNTVLLISAAVVSGTFILWPEITSKIAKMLGVGRGADFVFYISILVFWFVIIQLFSRVRKLEQRMTEIVRRDALRTASRLPIDEHNDVA